MQTRGGGGGGGGEGGGGGGRLIEPAEYFMEEQEWCPTICEVSLPMMKCHELLHNLYL